MPYGIDTSPLFRTQLPPAAGHSMAMGIGGIMAAVLERRRRLEEEEAKQAHEMRLKQMHYDYLNAQEQRLANRDKATDQRERDKWDMERRRDGSKAVMDAYGKNPQLAPLVAAAYGGSIEQAKPDYTDPNDPLGPGVQFTQPDESDPLGFTVNPEWERRTSAAEGRRVLRMPGADPVEFEAPAQEAQADPYARMREAISRLPLGPDRIRALQRLEMAQAADLAPDKALGHIDAGDRLAQQAARSAPRKGGGPPGAAKDKTDDLELLDRAGNVVALGRTPQEAADTRKKRTILAKAVKDGERLKQHILKHGRIGWMKGNSGEQSPRDAMIGSLIEARVAITGALNQGDVDLAKNIYDTSLKRGPEAAAQAVDIFVHGLGESYDEQIKSVASRWVNNSAVPEGAPGKPAGGRFDRLSQWESK